MSKKILAVLSEWGYWGEELVGPYDVLLERIFARLVWVGIGLPLIVPHFFANAYIVFLLRQ